MKQEFVGGIIPVCPVCERGVNRVCDEKAVQTDGVWFHGPCSRFFRYLVPVQAEAEYVTEEHSYAWYKRAEHGI